jgi:hypothetical protein
MTFSLHALHSVDFHDEVLLWHLEVAAVGAERAHGVADEDAVFLHDRGHRAEGCVHLQQVVLCFLVGERRDVSASFMAFESVLLSTLIPRVALAGLIKLFASTFSIWQPTRHQLDPLCYWL